MEISVQDLKVKMDNKEDFVLIDVREQHEYDEFNIGGKLIPLGNVMAALGELEDIKEKEVIVHCRSGKRSAMAQHLMIQAGFSNVKNLAGGVLAWQDM